ncbi:MAG: hypothetical protein OES79_11935 [Planctomycetota bacterium]|nr:hypothetical protein [Planctomycetota bacterium]
MTSSQPSQTPTADSRPAVTHWVPEDQPRRVSDVAERLLKEYRVEGGSVHLAGCTLDEVPIIRLKTDDEGREVYRIFGPADELGRDVDEQLFQQLGLQRLVAAGRPPTVSPREERRLIARAAEAAADIATGEDADEPDKIVWCKYARGKIQFTIGDVVSNVSFAGWARTVAPPAYRCPASGQEIFAVAATSDGRIVAAEQLAVCQQTGRRLPRCEMVRCAVTDELVSQELAQRCPVSGQMVLEQRLLECPVCREAVSPLAVERGRCAACRRLSAVSREDQQMLRILKQHPRLSSWQWLRLAETETAFLVMAAGFYQRRLLVLDKESLTVRHAARGNRLSGKWTDAASTEELGFW